MICQRALSALRHIHVLGTRRCLALGMINIQSQRGFNRPPGSDDNPRPGGVASMFRLPLESSTEGLDACFVGVPLDCGTSNRSGARFGPRQIREMSPHVGAYNMATGAAPYESLQVADVGDVYINQYNLPKAVAGIKQSFQKLISSGCRAISLGGDHTITYAILQAIKEMHGPVGLIHVDAHDDTADSMSGERVAHGTPLRRAGEEGCLDFSRVVQIGLRGQGYGPDDYEYGERNGFRMISAESCWNRSLRPLMEEVRDMMGRGPVYVSFDIDALDPAFAPGTGTPEVGGLTVMQGLEILRGCKGLNVVGGDVVEVSPPYDPQGTTAMVAANLAFELLCVLPGVKYHKKPE